MSISLLLSTVLLGQLTVIPDKATDGAAIVVSEKAGSWMIFTPEFNPIKPTKEFEGGKVAVIVGPPGTYMAVQLIQSETGVDWIAARMIIRGKLEPDPGPDPKPDPDPDPQPPPGKRKIVVLHESEQSNPQFVLTTQAIQKYCREKNHEYFRVDKDAVNPDGQQPAWLLEYLNIVRTANIELPAMVVVAEWQGKPYVSPAALPNTAQAALDKIKELGG